MYHTVFLDVINLVLQQESSVYTYSGTELDTRNNLNMITEEKLLELSVSAAEVAGQMALRLVHDHILTLDVDEYTRIIRKNMIKIMHKIKNVRVSFSSVKCFSMTRSKMFLTMLFLFLGRITQF